MKHDSVQISMVVIQQKLHPVTTFPHLLNFNKLPLENIY